MSKKEGENEINLKILWPLFFNTSLVALTFSSILMNMPALAKIIWPDDPYSLHAVDMGIVISVKTWSSAIVGLLFGIYADNRSRKGLMVITDLVLGLGYILTGFMPLGNGNISLTYLVICQSISGLALGGFMPITLSLIHDLVHSDDQSKFFGLRAGLQQLFMIFGMILSTFIIEAGYWRFYFWFIGSLIFLGALFIAIKIDEPKRAAIHGFGEKERKYTYTLNKDTFKSTILSRTNIAALIEGLFTRAALGMTLFMIIPYFQIEKNISASSTALTMVVFGLPGALIGNILFAKMSDRFGKKNIKNRVNLIVFSMIFMVLMFTMIFFVPFTKVTLEEGLNFRFLLSNIQFWIIGIFFFMQRSVKGVYDINQPPIIQAINLPETQGKISSWNQFLETIGNGLGPIIAALVLSASNQNYQISALVCILVGLPGAIIWATSNKTIKSDINIVKKILDERVRAI